MRQIDLTATYTHNTVTIQVEPSYPKQSPVFYSGKKYLIQGQLEIFFTSNTTFQKIRQTSKKLK